MKAIQSFSKPPEAGGSRAAPLQTPGEEIANAILHGLGVVFAITGLVFMTQRAGGASGAAYVIFAATLIAMFLSSTLYHAIQHRGAKRVLRIVDHAAIYLLIAGTYTPFCMLSLRGPWGWTLLTLEWTLALIGISLYAANRTFFKKAEFWVYMAMGWAILPGGFLLARSLPRVSILLLFIGGIVYTLGTLWYRKPHIRGAHAAWHAFVLAGAACHWSSIWFI